MSALFCKICREQIRSMHRHDFVSCKGGHIFVDGGNEYFRYGTLKEDVTDSDFEVRA